MLPEYFREVKAASPRLSVEGFSCFDFRIAGEADRQNFERPRRIWREHGPGVGAESLILTKY
jgi:hypothetical protein